MLLGSLDLLQDDPSGFFRLAVLIAFSLITAITVHEFSHALVSTTLGDNTARRLGRLSLNPARHLDTGGPIMMFIAGFGWANRCRWTPDNSHEGTQIWHWWLPLDHYPT